MRRARVCDTIVATVGLLGVFVVAGCGGEDNGGDQSLSALTSPATTSGASSTTAKASGSATTTAAPGGVQIVVAVPDSLTGQARAAGEAYGDYWTFVGSTLEKPPIDVDEVGRYMAGDALDALAGLARKRAADGIVTKGRADLKITNVTVKGAAATVCAGLQDLTATYSSKGTLQSPPDGKAQTFKATLRLEGPSWRTYTSTEVSSC